MFEKIKPPFSTCRSLSPPPILTRVTCRNVVLRASSHSWLTQNQEYCIKYVHCTVYTVCGKGSITLFKTLFLVRSRNIHQSIPISNKLHKIKGIYFKDYIFKPGGSKKTYFITIFKINSKKEPRKKLFKIKIQNITSNK